MKLKNAERSTYRSRFVDCFAPSVRPVRKMRKSAILLKNILGKKLVFECQSVNDEDALRRARLWRSFGLDFSEPGNETCCLVDD